MPALVLDPTEGRVLGVLIEKATTTPDVYPLSINSLQTGCNQKSNREPQTNLSQSEVSSALERLRRKGLVTVRREAGARVEKYGHLAGGAWELGERELAVLAELLLRGAQQPGELRGRASRMAEIPSLAELDDVLDALRTRGFVRRLDPLPGTRAARWEQIVAGEGGSAPDAGAAAARTPLEEGAFPVRRTATASADAPAAVDEPGVRSADHGRGEADLAERVAALEAEVARLARLLDDLTAP